MRKFTSQPLTLIYQYNKIQVSMPKKDYFSLYENKE